MALFVREFGSGPHPAVMLHCGLGQSSMWKGVATALAADFTIAAPDLPGHGRSPGWGAGDVQDQTTDAVRPFLRDGITLVGHSFGATVALRLALEQPARIASLTLIEPVFFAAAAGHVEHTRHRAAEESFFLEYQKGDLSKAARVFNRLWGGGIRWDSFPETVQKTMADNMPFVVGTEPSLWQDRAGMLVPGGLERLSMPVTFLRGAETVPIIAAVHAGLMARIPQAVETVVPGAAHMVVLTHPEAVAKSIRATATRAPT